MTKHRPTLDEKPRKTFTGFTGTFSFPAGPVAAGACSQQPAYLLHGNAQLGVQTSLRRPPDSHRVVLLELPRGIQGVAAAAIGEVTWTR